MMNLNELISSYIKHERTYKFEYITNIVKAYRYVKTIKSFGSRLQDTDCKVLDFQIVDGDEFVLKLRNLVEFDKINFKEIEYYLNAMIVDLHQFDFQTLICTFNRSKTNEYNRLPKKSVERLEAVLRYLNIKHEYIASMSNDFEINYEYWTNCDPKKMFRLKDSIAHKTGFKKEMFELEHVEGNTIFTIKKDEKHIFYLRDVLENTKKPKGMRIPLVLGIDKSGKVVFEDLTTMIHSLIGGTPGSGKSETLKQWIDSMLYYNDNVFVYCIDFKESALRRYKRFRKRCKYVNPEYSEIIALLEELLSEYTYRKKLFAEYEDETGLNCPDIHEWNKLNPESQLPYLLLAIDEATSFKDEFSKSEFEGKEEVIDSNGEIKKEGIKGVSPIIMTLLSKGRSLGIHVINAVQKSTEQCFSVKWRSLSFSRMCHKMREARQVQYVLECNVDEAKKVMNHDVGWYSYDRNGKYVDIKSTLTSQDLLNDIIEMYENMEGELENVEVVEEERK